MELMHQYRVKDTILASGLHAPDHAFTTDALSPAERLHIDGLSDRKRREWLASRDLLFRISGMATRPACLYDDFGKPYLAGSDRHISVSHSDGWCAAMIGPRPCGIDIQVYTKTVARIAPRFMTSSELARADRDPQRLRHLHLVWGAKECLYKAYGRRQLGFREHISLPVLSPTAGTGLGEIRYEGLHLRYELTFRFLPEAMWVACMLHADDLPDMAGGL